MGSHLSLVLATENNHKKREFQRALGPQFNLFTLDQVGFREALPVESGTTYEENSAIKANYVGHRLGVPILADDSGFEVEALGGIPGIYSARFFGGAESRLQCQEILKRMNGESNRRAKFVCVLSLYSPATRELKSFRGESCGSLSTEYRGSMGFGYDPIFIPDESLKTFAEMSDEEKWLISHRGRAFEAFRKILSEI